MTVMISGSSGGAPSIGGAIGSGAPIVGGSSRSTSRSKAGGGSGAGLRQSSTRIRSSGGHGGSSHTQGGHPMAGAEPSKIDIKHRFEITAKLGSGTYGKVSLAYDHKTEREVAVKLIKKSAIENKQDLVRIRREIRIMSMLKHPNIIQIYEVFENKDKIILVMEYANGGELYDYVSKFGSLPEAEARRIFRQITSAVLYCHKHKVAHRDLKLENILLDSRNNAKIADFGLSNYFSEKNLLSTFCGSPLYASPEIINGTPYKGPEVDCWSLGILLYTLVYGSMPFDGRDFNRMVRQIKRGAYYEPDTPSTASMLIRNMLRVNPDRRADIDDIASHWWLNLEENMPVIQELPENQITDHTPLTERAEIMVVQDLADETDVFMEFGHLSSATRQKIEEFRRRRKEAEEYNESSPVKPPKHRRTSLKNAADQPELTAREKSLRGVEEPKPIVAPATKMDHSTFQDPLDRLRQLESRLQGGGPSAEQPNASKREKARKASIEEQTGQQKAAAVTAAEDGAPPPAAAAPVIGDAKQKRKKSLKKERQASTEAAKSPRKDDAPFTSKQPIEERRPAFISPTEYRARRTGPAPTESAPDATDSASTEESASALEDVRQQTRQYWKMGTDSLNLLMNQVLEQMEKGPVSLNLIARIKAHAFYDQRPMVKELLESIIAAQPAAVQKETSKIIQQQQSQELIRRQGSSHKSAAGLAAASSAALKKAPMDTVPESKPLKTVAPAAPPPRPAADKYRVAELPNHVELNRSLFKVLDHRPWHSVEVGFSTDEETSSNNTDSGGAIESAAAGLNIRKTSGTAPKFIGTRSTRSEPRDEFDIDDEEEFYDADEHDEEEYESDIDELAEEVEQVATEQRDQDGGASKAAPAAAAAMPRIVENLAETVPQSPAAASGSVGSLSPNHLSTTTLERGLAKRQSKGKYQFLYNHVEMYGRGVSMEAESPPVTRRRIGGPQPRIEQSPILFDKAKNYLINYPDKMDDSDTDVTPRKSRSPATGHAAAAGSGKGGAGDAAEAGKKPTGAAWLQTRDPSVSDNKSTSSAVTTAQHSQEDISQKPSSDDSDEKAKKKLFSSKKAASKTGGDDEDEEEEEEEEETDDEGSGAPFRPRPSTIIGFRTIQPIGADGVQKEAPIVKVKPQAPSGAAAAAAKKRNSIEAGTPPRSAALDATRRASYHRRGSGAGGDSLDGSGAEEGSGTPLVGERQKHESASAYIRRKNRERRARNQTIAVAADDSWSMRSSENQENYPSATAAAAADDSARRKSSLGGRLSIERSFDSGGGVERRPSYLEERRHEPNYLRQAYVDRRKSYHEMTPLRAAAEAAAAAEQRCFSPLANGRADAYLSGANAYDRYGVTAGGYGHYRAPTNMSRYEDEIFHAFYPNSALHGDTTYADAAHRRFEVYRTRAERATDAPYSSDRYRNGGSGYHYAGDAPAGAAYRPFSRYDDVGAPSVAGHRRSLYDPVDRPITPGMDYGASYGIGAPGDSPNGAGGTSNGRARGAPGRRGSTSRDDVSRRLRARSQSNDRMLAVVMRDELDANDALFNARLMTPEMGGGGYDYGYVGYHDTGRPSGGGAAPIARAELDFGQPPSRSILKSKPPAGAFEGSMRNVFGRLRRHLSTTDRVGVGLGAEENEPHASIKSRPYTGRTSSFDEDTHLAIPGSRLSDLTGSAAATDGVVSAAGGGSAAGAQKKRSFLNLSRRRTTEITANSILADEDYKRPRSPIDRLKSLFRPSGSGAGGKKDGGTRDSGVSSAASGGAGGYAPSSSGAYSSGASRYSSALSADVSTTGYGGYSSASSTASKRYTGAATSRYGFTSSTVSGAKSSPRSWYDDPHHF